MRTGPARPLQMPIMAMQFEKRGAADSNETARAPLAHCQRTMLRKAFNHLVVSRCCVSVVLCLAATVSVIADEPNAPSALSQKLNRLSQNKQSDASSTSQPIGNPVYKQMLKSVALIEMVTDEGTVHGTGWVVDARQRLIVTNHHVIEDMLDCYVYFPEFVDGKLNTDPESSLDQSRGLYGVVIDSDETFDLALVQLKDELPNDVVEMELADASATPGQTIHSIAGTSLGSQSLWIYSTGHVRQIVNGVLANDHETILLESDMATNQGNSGGPVCDDQGRVVAVVEGHRTDARLVSLYIELQALADYLRDALRCVDPQSVEDLQFAAERHLNDNRPSVAANLLTKAIKRQPTSAELFADRGWCWYALDDLESAIADFEEAIENDSTYSDAHGGLAWVAIDNDDLEAAVEHLTDAIRNDSQTTWYLTDRGDCYRKLGQYDSAVRDAKAALRLETDNIDATRVLAMVDIDLGKYQEGIDKFDTIIEEFDDDAETLVYCAIGMFHLEQFEISANLCTLALEHDEEYYQAYFQQGAAFLKMERYADALNVLAIANENLPDNPGVMLLYAIALYQNNQAVDALTVIDAARKLSPEDQNLKQVYDNIQAEVQAAQQPMEQPVSTRNVPTRFIGTWKAQVQHQSEVITMELTLSGEGRYAMNANRRSSQGNDANSDAGVFQISNDQLVYQSDESDEPASYRIKWQGNHLAIYVEEFGGWILHYRANQ